MKLSVLGQVHYSFVENTKPRNDFYLRRGRFILAGQVMDGVMFFVETDNDNAGKNGVEDASTDIQDAFVDVRIGDSSHWVQAGLILLPFSFENRSSAASLLGIDYNAEAIKCTNTFVWRDYGAELHGNFGKKFAYRVGAFDGYDSENGTKNPSADLRFTGHLAYNLIGEVETGWFYTQNRLGKSQYLTIGVGGDGQNEATLAAKGDTQVGIDSYAWVVDFQSGFDVRSAALTVNGAYHEWDNANFLGHTAFVESGLLAGKTMLTVKYSLQDDDHADTMENYTAGVHYFLKGHNARAGLEYRLGDGDDSLLLGFQFLL